MPSQSKQPPHAAPRLTRAEQSRLNGSRSRGPTTPEGKSRSAQNSLRHSYCSKTLLLNNDNAETFDQFRQAYIDRFRPADFVELDIVENLTANSWKIKQNMQDQTALIDREMDLLRATQSKPSQTDEMTRTAVAVESLDKKGTTLFNLRRYEAQLQRTYTRLLNALRALQQDRRKNPPEQNEPEPLAPTANPDLKTNPSEPRNTYSAAETSRVRAHAHAEDGICAECEAVIHALAPYPEAHRTAFIALENALENRTRRN